MRYVIRRTIIQLALFGVVLYSARAAGKAQPPTPLPVQTLAQFGDAASDAPVPGPGTFSFKLPQPGRAMRITGRAGVRKAAWQMHLLDARGRPITSLTLSVTDPLEAYLNVQLVLPDRSRFRRPYFVKPDLKFYPPKSRQRRFNMQLADGAAFDERDDVAAKYHLFPSVLEHPFTIQLEAAKSGLEIWLDGRFIGSALADAGVVAGRVVLADGNAVVSASDVPALRRGRLLPLDLNPYGRPGALGIPALPENRSMGSMSDVESVPLLTVRPGRNINVGLSRWIQERIDPPDFCDLDTTRSAFDGCPETIMLRVPKENFLAAQVLCAVDPSPGLTPVLTLRLTRFGNHYGDSGGRCDRAIGDTTVYLPTSPAAAEMPAGVRLLGEVEVDAVVPRVHMWTYAKRKLPVYLVRVPLKVGAVTDLLGEDAPVFGRRKDYWNIELTKEIRTTVQQFNLQSYRLKPIGLPSAVHVLGMTLERAPIDVEVTAKEKGNIFYAADDPAFEVRLVNHLDTPSKVTLSCDITDFYGRKSQRTLALAVPAKGSAQGRIPLSMDSLGYFDAVITARLEDGTEIWREPTSFALLPPDTRQAGNESPFGVWWFDRTHGCCRKLEWIGPILQRAGIRHCCPGSFTEAELKPYKLSYSMVPSMHRRPKRAVDFIKKHPNIRLAMIFHERGIPDTEAPFPELMGRPKPELSERGKAIFDKYWKAGEEIAAWYRENYPNIKLSFGNSPPGISVWFMRHGWPKKWVDCFGMEGVGAWHMTESPPRRGAMQEVWWLSEMRKHYGYGDVPVSSGYEYITRGSQPGALTERQQGEYHTRDAIHGLAYGFLSINIGLADDCADSYYSTIYGGSGFVRRNPLLTPKPGYVMYATMTRLLDRAKYQRYLDTGSRSLYVLEFARGANRVYPIWTLRGRRALSLTATDARVAVTDSMGNTRELQPRNGTISVEATTAPMYLVTAAPVQKVVPGEPSYDETPPENAYVVSDCSGPAAWQVEHEPDTYLETFADDVPYVRGKFGVRAVTDAQKAKALELELLPSPDIPKLAGRYVSLRLKKPVVLEQEATRIGMWVKGNSCWGRVFWEFRDAKGETYFSTSDETSGWEVSDWKNRSSINFDDWCFVSMQIPKRYPGGFHRPDDRDWRHVGGTQDGVVQHPITITRILVAMRDYQVYVTELVPAQSRTIRLKDLIVGLAEP